MKIINGNVFNEDFTFSKRDVFVSDGLIAESSNSDKVIDAEGLYVIPGLIDSHFHGAVGEDISDGSLEGLKKIAEYEASQGVVALAPATVTIKTEEAEKSCNLVRDFKPELNEADIVAVHLEGPFINVEKKGAQNPDYIINPCLDVFNRLYKAGGDKVRIISLAPEKEFAMELISEIKDKVSASIAHTTADYETAKEAFAVGANRVTHLFNAMPPFHHRDPGVIGAAIDNPNVSAELITDGIHIHPSVIRATFKLFGADRVILVSDSMRATGLTDGEYTLGGLRVKVEGKLATIIDDGAIAGSTTNLMKCVEYAVNTVGIPLEDAIKAATANPAKSINIYDDFGSISTGKVASLVLLDKDLQVQKVILRGKEL